MKVVYNPINIGEINKFSKENVNILRNVNSKFKIISVGRLVKQKNYSNLIKAFEIVQKRFHNCHLIICGEGPERKKLKEIVNSLNIKKYVTFLGAVQNPYKFLKKSDLFVLSSDYEGFGTVLLEAMVFNLPIVSTDCDYGPREILKNYQRKKLVKVNCHISLAKGILELMRTKKKINNTNLLEYDTNNILSKYLKL